MSDWTLIYYKLLSFPLSILVKSKSIPKNPALELGLDISQPIMYVLPYSSKTDLLTLRAKCIEHNLPDPLKPLIINGIALRRYVHVYDKLSACSSCTLQEESFKLFHNYLDLHRRNPKLNAQIVPIYVMLGRRPNYRKIEISSFFRISNNIKKFFTIVWLGRDSFVIFSPFVSFRWIITERGTDKTIVQKLARVARIYFERQRLAAVGPYLSTRQSIFRKLLSSKAITHAVEEEARSKKISYKKAQKNAINLLKEISANFSYEMVRVADRILHFAWHRLYQGISVHNVSRVRQIANNGHKMVYIPCHRSHMDYLLLSYVLYHQGLMLPHIAAGINLNFWPAGPIFRRLGAFFIRRSFKGNKFYSIVFREYLEELFNKGYSVEYFVEGSRSRTGRLLDPKTGTLSITIQAALRSRTRPITLVPIYIGYEHVVEINTYTRELYGESKKKESLSKVLLKLIKLRNLGQGYVNFGEPLSLMTWLNQHIPNWHNSINPTETVRPIWLTSVVNDIAIDLMVRINNAGATNAMNLICTALLASRQRLLTRDQLIKQLDCYLSLMRNVPYSKESTVPSISSSTLVDYVLQINKFQIKKNCTIGDVIGLSNKQARLLYYYRNNIAHMLVLPSLIAVIIIQHHYTSRQMLLHYISILYPMLKAEMFLRWKLDELENELNKLTSELLRQELILLKDNKLYANPLHFVTLQLLGAGVYETLQRYAIIFWLLSKNSYFDRFMLEKESETIAQKLSLLHDINIQEFFDKTVFNMLISTLRKEGYISNSGSTKLEKTKKVYQMLTKLITLDIRLTIETKQITIN